jgi:hypothetical protein
LLTDSVPAIAATDKAGAKEDRQRLIDKQKNQVTVTEATTARAPRQRRWNSVACQPWLSLRSELAADLKDQPVDAIWRTIEYGFPAPLKAPNY